MSGRRHAARSSQRAPQEVELEVLSRHMNVVLVGVAQAATHGQAAKQQKITSGLTFRVGSSELKGSAAS